MGGDDHPIALGSCFRDRIDLLPLVLVADAGRGRTRIAASESALSVRCGRQLLARHFKCTAPSDGTRVDRRDQLVRLGNAGCLQLNLLDHRALLDSRFGGIECGRDPLSLALVCLRNSRREPSSRGRLRWRRCDRNRSMR
jgi:hypothetical protein